MEHASLFQARINIALHTVLLCYGLLGNYAIYLQLGWPGIIIIATVAAGVGAATWVYGSKWRFQAQFWIHVLIGIVAFFFSGLIIWGLDLGQAVPRPKGPVFPFALMGSIMVLLAVWGTRAHYALSMTCFENRVLGSIFGRNVLLITAIPLLGTFVLGVIVAVTDKSAIFFGDKIADVVYVVFLGSVVAVVLSVPWIALYVTTRIGLGRHESRLDYQ